MKTFENYIALSGGIPVEIIDYEQAVKCKFSINGFMITLIAESDCTFVEFKQLIIEAVNRQVSDLAYKFGIASKERDELVKRLGLKPVKRSFWRVFL